MQLSRCPRARGPWEPDAGTGGRRGPLLSEDAPSGRPPLVSPGRERMLDRSDAFSRLPRKEVIQPHLPVRLPCYDFTPLTLHTFDASAPRGFGRRLRVQTTRVG